MKSHIQIPRSILRQFEDSLNRLYYIDMMENPSIIHSGHSRSFNTEDGLFSEETEVFLNRVVETSLSSIRKFISSTEDDSISISSDITDAGFAYLYSLHARSPKFRKVNGNPSADIFVKSLISSSIRTRLLRDIFNMSFAKNLTSSDFVLPTGGVIQISQTDILCPLSPKDAILFYNSDDTVYKTIDAPSVINAINILAMKTEKANDCGCIVSSSKQQLEKLYNDWRGL